MQMRRSLSGPLLYLALVLLLVSGIGIGAFEASVSSSLQDLQNGSEQHLELYAAGMDSEIARFAHLPEILGLSPTVAALLQKQHDKTLQSDTNHYLEALNDHTGARAIYILNQNGRVIATSNWHRPDSYLGENDAFRPYFQESIHGKSSRFFGVGTTRSEPGYYLAEPLYDGNRTTGVVVVKIGLTQLEETWAAGRALVWVSDVNNVVILASRPEWKFGTLSTISAKQAQLFYDTRQYNRLKLKRLGIDTLQQLNHSARIVRWAEPGSRPHRYLAETRPLAGSNWQLTELISLAPVYNLALSRAALAGVLAALALTGLFLLNERRRRLRDKLAARVALQRAYLQLEHKVDARTADLSTANRQLKEEVADRIRAEEHLRQTQAELVQAGKLAVIGQLSTQIAHELNQPLAALRTLSGNTVKYLARGDQATASTNLETMAQLVERMGKITGSLRSFARKSTNASGSANLRRTLDNALFLLDQQLRQRGVQVIRDEAAEDLDARCDANRLEQVLVNLLTNALYAIQERQGVGKDADPLYAVQQQHDARIEIHCSRNSEQVTLTLRDNGPGFSDSTLAHLFEPFFTTKPAGVGLGLGLTLSASIINEAGGTLSAGNHPEGGAVITLILPAADKEHSDD